MSTQLASYGRYGLHTLQYPSGKWGFVGTIPAQMCIEKITKTGLKYMDTPSFDTEQLAIDYHTEIMNKPA